MDNVHDFDSCNIIIIIILLSLLVLSLRGSLSFVSTTEELLGRKSSGSGLENREYGRRDPPR
jgi:hypothetical protein